MRDYRFHPLTLAGARGTLHPFGKDGWWYRLKVDSAEEGRLVAVIGPGWSSPKTPRSFLAFCGAGTPPSPGEEFPGYIVDMRSRHSASWRAVG